MKNLLASVAISALYVMLGSQASAQTSSTTPDGAADNASTGLGDIVVTARKKSQAELVQDIPVAVSAVTGAQLEANQTTTLTAVAQTIPNVAMDELSALKGTANFSIRGLGLNSSIPTLEPTAGVFIDGVYLASTQGVILDLFDLDGIEILRGPQGTLFGKNVTGGAVVVRSRAPSDRFEVRGRFSVETGPEWKAAGSVSGPIAEGLKVRLSAMYDKDEGWFRNRFDNSSFGKSETWLVRPSVLWEPSDSVSLTLRYEHGDTKGDGAPNQNRAFHDRHSFSFRQDYRGFNNMNWDMITSELNVDVNFGDGVITNVAGYRDLKQSTGADIDGTEILGFINIYDIGVEQFSNELRYAGTFFDRLDITAGLYYFTSDITSVETRILRPLNGVPRTFGGRQSQDTYAVFAQGDYKFTESLSLTLGARYSTDKKNADIAIFSPVANTCNAVTKACNYSFSDLSDRWNSFTPKIGLQYRASRDVQVYGSWTKAYRAGGYNVRVTSPTQNLKFDQESTSAFEAGAKADLFDRRVRTNVALFYNKVRNMIRDVNIPSPTGGQIQDARNTADTTIWGAELEAKVLLADNLELNGFAGYQDSDYDRIRFSLLDLPGEVPGTINDTDLSLKLPRLSKWSYGVGFLHTLALGNDMKVRSRANYSHRDSVFIDDANTATLNALNMLDASVSLGLRADTITLTLFGRNVLNDAYQGYATILPTNVVPPVPPGRRPEYSGMSEGRVIGLELNFRL